jgi:hypothetical protein
LKDVATLHSEIDHLTRDLAKIKTDMRFIRMFVSALVHPEEYGHAIPKEIRDRAVFVLKETEWVGR